MQVKHQLQTVTFFMLHLKIGFDVRNQYYQVFNLIFFPRQFLGINSKYKNLILFR